MPEQRTTTLSKSWTIRMVVITAACLGLGLWGLYDATVAYPARGVRAAERLELSYLEKADEVGRLARTSIDDPAADFERLRSRMTLDDRFSDLDLARYKWLDSLAIVSHLDPLYTALPRDGAPSAQDRLETLRTSLNTKSAAKPLNRLDITFQWIIFGVSGGIGLIVLAHFVNTGRKKFRWNPDELRLTLPGGASFVPDDVEEFDRRKWHKFLMFVRIKPGHPGLGGRELKLDLLQHAGLEPWVLEMERAAFPNEAADQPDEPEPEEQAPEEQPTG